MSNPSQLIGTRQVAEMLGESIRQTIRRVEAGTLTPVTKLPGIRGAYVFDLADIEPLTGEEAS